MRSGMVAVWDPDREYGEKLSEYLRRQGDLGGSVVWFCDVQKLRQAVEGGQVSVAVMAQTGSEAQWMETIPTVVLTQERTRELAGVDEPVETSPAATKRCYFYKYRSVRELLRRLSGMREQEITSRKRGEMSPGTLPGCGQPARIRGVYSPLGGCLKTSLGLVMGCLLAEEKRCLFLSLEAHAGFRTLFGRQYPVDLSDLFAMIRQDGNWLGILSEALQPFGKLQYVPPVIWPVDVREAEFSELKELLQRLALCGRFDEIILDVGQDLACPEKVLQLCDEIYQPEKEDVFSQGKLTEYEAYLRITGQDSLCQRTRRIPVSRLSAGTDSVALDQWQRWEQMIPVVRQILQEASHAG